MPRTAEPSGRTPDGRERADSLLVALSLLSLALALLLLGGCAHRPTLALNAAHANATRDWAAALTVHGVRRPSDVERVDYWSGACVLRLRQPPLSQYIPIGAWAREYGGVISSRKEWLSRPALLPDLAGWGMAAAFGAVGLILVVPEFQATEEAIHASDEIKHPAVWKLGEAWVQAITLAWLPVAGDHVSPILRRTVFYYLDPRELKAKAQKILMLSAAPNTHCPAAVQRWRELIAFVAFFKIVERGEWTWPGSPAHRAEIEKTTGAYIVSEYQFWFPSLWDGVFGDEVRAGPRMFPRLL